MLNVKKLNFISKDKKKTKYILYLLSFFIIFFVTYLSAPKFLNFSLESIKENLKNNNNININNISEVNYKVFPTPRLYMPNSNFIIGDGIIEVTNSEIEIILDINHILNFKEINYKKLLINKGQTKINLNNINQVQKNISRNKKQLIFKKNNLVFFHKDKMFLEVKDTFIKISKNKEKEELRINGNFLNNKISIKLDNVFANKNNLILSIPELDIAAKVFFEKNNSGDVKGFLNLEIFNNFLKFNFIKDDKIKLTNGFIRSKLINSSINGEVAFKPNFFSMLNFKISNFNIEKFFTEVQNNYFSKNNKSLSFIKKINGIFNFESKFTGRIISKNGEILFENFRTGKNKSFFLNARINEFGKKGKIKFNLIKVIKYKKNLSRKIEVRGLIIPASSRVVFEKFLLDDNEISTKKTKEHEDKFKDELIQNYLGNIFNESKINKYLKNLF
jgi:hypothetical protein